MTVLTVVGSILAIITTLLPVLIADYASTKKANNDLTNRSIDELRAGAERLRDKSTV